MPSEEPVAVVHLAWVIVRDRAEIPVDVGIWQPSSRVVLVSGGAIHHFLDSCLEIGEPRRILGKGENYRAGNRSSEHPCHTVLNVYAGGRLIERPSSNTNLNS
jgi:hypothetical protein